MNELKLIHARNIKKLKHLYRNPNHTLENVLGSCYFCLEDLNQHNTNQVFNYLCHDDCYSLCDECYKKYVTQDRCICDSPIKRCNGNTFWCKTYSNSIDMFKDRNRTKSKFSYLYLVKFMDFYKKLTYDEYNALIITLVPEKVDEKSIVCPRIIEVYYYPNIKKYIIRKRCERTQEMIERRESEDPTNDIMKMLSGEKVMAIDMCNGEDIVLSEYYYVNNGSNDGVPPYVLLYNSV